MIIRYTFLYNISMIKKVKVTKYNKYSKRIIIPASYSRYLDIDENTILDIILDKKNKCLVLRKGADDAKKQ